MFQWLFQLLSGHAGREKDKLESKRVDTINEISQQRAYVELMAQRPRAEDDILNLTLLESVLKCFVVIENGARQATTIEELEHFREEAGFQGLMEAYLCPANEIRDEALRALDNVSVWGIPKDSVKKLHEMFDGRLKNAVKEPEDGRGALHSIFVEVDEWSDYIEEYEGTMDESTRSLFWTSIVLFLLACLSLHFAYVFTPLLCLGLVFAGAAGSSVSIMAKMPALDLSLNGELDAYGRRIRTRMIVGAVGSLVGCAFLGWGVLPIAIKDQTFSDALTACTTATATAVTATPAATATGTAVKMLIVIGVAMLLGVSERTLTSFEQRVFGASKNPKG